MKEITISMNITKYLEKICKEHYKLLKELSK